MRDVKKGSKKTSRTDRNLAFRPFFWAQVPETTVFIVFLMQCENGRQKNKFCEMTEKPFTDKNLCYSLITSLYSSSHSAAQTVQVCTLTLGERCALAACVTSKCSPKRESKPLWYNDHMGSSVNRSHKLKRVHQL